MANQFVSLQGPQIERQKKLAEMLLEQGNTPDPISTYKGIQAYKPATSYLAKIAEQLMGVYAGNKAADAQDEMAKSRAATMGQAITQGMGRPAESTTSPGGTKIDWAEQKPDMAGMLRTLGGNPQTAPEAMGAALSMGMKDREFGQQRQATAEDRTANQNFTREQTAAQQGFQAAQSDLNRAQQVAMQDKSIAAQQALQNAQQRFTGAQQALAQTFQAGQNQAQRDFTLNSAGPMAAARTAAELGAQNAPTTIQGPNGPMQVPAGAAADIAKTIAAPKPLTDEQSKAAGFADRMTQAGSIIDKMNSVGTDLGQAALDKMPGVGNFLVSDEKQQLTQAKRDFVNSILRRESGAVISDAEFANADKQYFPQPGDSEAVLKQKKANRDTALFGMQRSAGKATPMPKDTAPRVVDW